MKKFLLALTVLGSATCANAVTVDDLMQWGGYCIENTKSNRMHQSVKWLSSSAETKFEKVSDTQLKLTGMFDDEFSFTFTLGNGYDIKQDGTTTTDGTQLFIKTSTYSNSHNGRYYLNKSGWNTNNKYGIYSNSNFVGEISEIKDASGNLKGYKIVFGSVMLRNKNDGAIFGNMECYDGYELEVYEPNAWITETGYNIYAESWEDPYMFKNRRIPARLDFNNDGTFNLLGLSACGYAINASNQLVPVKGTLYDDNTLYLDQNQHMLFAEETIKNWSGTSYSWSPYYLYEIDAAGELFMGVDGTWDETSKLSHRGTSTWVTNDGDCRTQSGLHMKLEDYTYASAPNQNIYGDLLLTYISENVSIDMVDDHTHAVELKLNSYGADDKYGVYVNATITPIKNHNYIESYDLFMVEGTHSSIKNNYFNGNLCPNNGHVAALHLTGDNDFSTDFDPSNTGAQKVNRIEANKGAQSVNLLIPVSALPNGKTSKDGYTFFVRANYSNDSNLAPTFHDMKYFQGTPTSIDGIQAEDAIVISAGAGEIIVKGAEGTVVEVYNAAGVQVYAGTDSSIAVEAGLYIVKVGSKAQKVVVR